VTDGRELRSRTWPSVPPGTTVVLPVGSVEQHGPHLPLDTDTIIASAVADRVARRLGQQTLVAPPIAYGASGEHQAFAGTASVGREVLELTVVELVRSMTTWAERVVIVNGHGGNVSALRAAVGLLTAEGRRVEWHPCRAGSVDAHAGRSETSLVLHLDPVAVRLVRAEAGNSAPLRTLMPVLATAGVGAVSANGVLGDPSGASAEEGSRLLDAMVEEIVATVLAEATR
jgi:creatinine amidohydrolase